MVYVRRTTPASWGTRHYPSSVTSQGIRPTVYATGRRGCYVAQPGYRGLRVTRRYGGHRYYSRRSYNRCGYPYSSSVVVWPRTVLGSQYVEPIYATERVIEQEVIQQPAWETAWPLDPPGTDAVTILPQAGRPAQDELLAPLRAGDAAFRAGDYADARRHYVRAQLERAYEGEATLAYALTHFAEGNYQLAALSLRRGLEVVPDAIHEPIDLVWFYGQTGALEQHLQALTTYLAQRPGDLYGWFLLGYVRFGAGDVAGAIEAFDRAIAVDPDDLLCQLLREAALAVSNLGPIGLGGDASIEPLVRGSYLYSMPPEVPG